MTNSPSRTLAKTSLILTIMAAIGLCVGLTASAVMAYLYLAHNEFAAGQTAYLASDWPLAYGHFARVTGYYRFGIPDKLSEAQALEAETSLLSYADDQRTQKDYASALAAYATYLDLYPASGKRPQVVAQARATYLAWVADLQASQDFAGAVEKGRELQAAYPDSSSTQPTDELLAAVYWAWADALQQQAQFEPAIQKLEVIQSQYPQTSYGSKIRQRLAEVYGRWGKSLSVAGDFAAAVEKYESLRANFADQPATQNVESALAELYLGWADDQSRAGHYAVAIEKYNRVIHDFATQPETAGAQQALAEAELRYAGQLWAANQPVLAVVYASHGLDIFENLFVATPQLVTPQQTDLIRGTYREMGQFLLEDRHYIGAIALYTNAAKYIADPASQADWLAGQTAATQALSNDPGSDGQQVLADALKTACQGQPTSWPVIGATQQTVQFGLCPDAADLNLGELQAVTPGALHYVIRAETVDTTISSCAYSGAHVLTRYRVDLKLTIYEALTGAIAKQTTVAGTFPPPCPGTYSFPATAFSTASMSGEDPSPEAVQKALAPLLAGLK